MAKLRHGIKAVSRRTGLTAYVIRIWEKRYGAVKPVRTGTNRRLFSEEQIERLTLLRDLTQGSYSIGLVASLPIDQLRKLAASAAPSGALEDCIAAVKALDSAALGKAFKRAAVALGSQGVLHQVVAPLVHTIGDLWRNGTITAAHEHFASETIRVFLANAGRYYTGSEEGPRLVVGTATGQLHELGALLVGAMAANLGWRVVYLGASLPAAEIAGATRQCGAAAVALSFVYPEDDRHLAGELARLREYLPAETVLLTGGRAMPAYQDALRKIGAIQITDLLHLAAVLDELRRPAKRTQ